MPAYFVMSSYFFIYYIGLPEYKSKLEIVSYIFISKSFRRKMQRQGRLLPIESKLHDSSGQGKLS